jgi:8-amino-7-oxononanoate synthase
MADINLHLQDKLHRLAQKGLLRKVVSLEHLGKSRLAGSGRTWLNLSGNDYLGLAANRELVEAFYQRIDPATLVERFGPGAAASRLMTGNSGLYDQLEGRLAALYGKERCLVFNSGYHGNAGILPALAQKGDLIVADKLCHASLIDGMRLSMARTLRYNHLDYRHLEEILEKKRNQYSQVFLVSEAVFSMDGDTADLHRLVALKKKYRCCLYLDEAHAVGVLGRQGLGLAEQEGCIRDIDLLFGTFGKALGGIGGFVACSGTIGDYLVNRARTLIYTTGLPPVCLNWLLFVLDRVVSMESERERLQVLATKVRRDCSEHGLTTGGSTQIIPIIIGESDKTVAAAEKLRQQGFWVTAVRPPTVPDKTARLRLSLTADMCEEDLTPLAEIIAGSLV